MESQNIQKKCEEFIETINFAMLRRLGVKYMTKPVEMTLPDWEQLWKARDGIFLKPREGILVQDVGPANPKAGTGAVAFGIITKMTTDYISDTVANNSWTIYYASGLNNREFSRSLHYLYPLKLNGDLIHYDMDLINVSNNDEVSCDLINGPRASNFFLYKNRSQLTSTKFGTKKILMELLKHWLPGTDLKLCPNNNDKRKLLLPVFDNYIKDNPNQFTKVPRVPAKSITPNITLSPPTTNTSRANERFSTNMFARLIYFLGDADNNGDFLRIAQAGADNRDDIDRNVIDYYQEGANRMNDADLVYDLENYNCNGENVSFDDIKWDPALAPSNMVPKITKKIFKFNFLYLKNRYKSIKGNWNVSGSHNPDKDFLKDFLNGPYCVLNNDFDRELVHLAFCHFTKDDATDSAIDLVFLNLLHASVASSSDARDIDAASRYFPSNSDESYSTGNIVARTPADMNGSRKRRTAYRHSSIKKRMVQLMEDQSVANNKYRADSTKHRSQLIDVIQNISANNNNNAVEMKDFQSFKDTVERNMSEVRATIESNQKIIETKMDSLFQLLRTKLN